jgi:uncharacterized protein
MHTPNLDLNRSTSKAKLNQSIVILELPWPVLGVVMGFMKTVWSPAKRQLKRFNELWGSMSKIESMIHATARGSTWHARLAPKVHRFKYQSAMIYLDLDRLNDFQQTALKVNQTGFVSFNTFRHLCDDLHPSSDEARQFASSVLGMDFSGPVKLLTNPHYFGFGFNPLSVYFLHHQDETPGALIYEVSNTPWNEIHRYVIPYSKVASGETFVFEKSFHVSPFNPITQHYVTRVRWPYNGQVSIYLGLRDNDDERLMFEAGLNLSLIPYDGRSIKPLFLGVWPQTFIVIGGIYLEAFALWRKGVTYHPHP